MTRPPPQKHQSVSFTWMLRPPTKPSRSGLASHRHAGQGRPQRTHPKPGIPTCNATRRDGSTRRLCPRPWLARVPNSRPEHRDAPQHPAAPRRLHRPFHLVVRVPVGDDLGSQRPRPRLPRLSRTLVRFRAAHPIVHHFLPMISVPRLAARGGRRYREPQSSTGPRLTRSQRYPRRSPETVGITTEATPPTTRHRWAWTVAHQADAHCESFATSGRTRAARQYLHRTL